MKKYKIFALLLNLSIGTGHLYIGQIKKAFLLLLAPIVLLVISSILELYINFSLFFAPFILIILYIYSFIDIWKSFPIKDNKKLKYSKWYYVILFIIFNSSIQLFVTTKQDILPTRHFLLPTSSMNTTLFKGDYIVAIKRNNFHRGDIVVFKNPLDTNIYFVKRIFALSGDEIIYQDKKIFIHFKEGNDYIRKKFPSSSIYTIQKKLWVENPYLITNSHITYQPTQYSIFQLLSFKQNSMSKVFIEELSQDIINKSNSGEKFNAFYKKIEKDSYFMIGDNRNNSNDSRFFGSIPKKDIYGVLKKVYFNYKTWNRFNLKVK